jgi:putative peptidoglycan binding protein
MSPAALSFETGRRAARTTLLGTQSTKPRHPLPHRYPGDLSDAPYRGATEPMAVGAPASEYVRWLQATLRRALDAPLAIDGVMTRLTRHWIRAFQRRCRLPITGYVGPDTEAALRRVGAKHGRDDSRFEAEFELTGAAGTAEKALAPANATPIDSALRALGKTPVPGLYRFHAPDGRFYTGQSIDLRRRILQNAWCLSHLGQSVRPFKIAFHRVPGADETKLRTLEKAINAHQKRTNNRNRLNTLTELEFLELENI